MQTTQRKTPNLRFPEFRDEWQADELGKLSDVRDGTHESPKYVDYGVPLITSKNLQVDGSLALDDVSYITETDFNKINRRSGVDVGDILFGMIGTIGNPVKVRSNRFAIKNVALLKERDQLLNNFLIYYLSSPNIAEQFHTDNAGGTQKFIALGVIRKLNVVVPSQVEQQKIAEFLTAVDGKIELMRKRIELLKKYKKGVMQKIFSQEIRFKDEYGKSFPDWEEKKLGDFFDYEQPTKYIVKSTEYSNSHKTPVLTAGKTFILGYTDETDGIFKDQLPVVIFDDFTTASQYVDFPFKVKSSAMKILKTKDGISPKIAYELLRRVKFSADDHKRYWIAEYQNFNVMLPSTEEQKKIADFLTALDDKINLEESKLEQTKRFKKALLQQMFV